MSEILDELRSGGPCSGDIACAADVCKEAAGRIEELESALKDVEDYLAGIADCDMDQDGYVPNPEMRLLVQVRAALYGKDAL